MRLANPAFTEQGAGALDLSVSEQVRTSAKTFLGIKTSHLIDTGTGNLRIEPRILWSHEFGNIDTAPITAQITGGGTAGSFEVQGVAVRQDGVVLGLGLSGQPRKNLTLFADASADLKHGQSATALVAGVRYEY